MDNRLTIESIKQFPAPPGKKYEYLIGIDPGVETGLAIWGVEEKSLIQVKTMMIHQALEKISRWNGLKIFVRIEDARKRKWFGNAGREQLQGAGSIKRDCKIWEDFLTDNNIPFELVAPKNNKTKINSNVFKQITRWPAQTNEHSRDAAMLVFGFNIKQQF